MTDPCVYVQIREDGVVLYVGMSLYFGERTKSHQSSSEWFNEVSRVEVIHCNSKEDALQKEAHIYDMLKPLYGQASKRKRRFSLFGVEGEIIENFMRGSFQ